VKRASMSDVAAKAGVSKTTVSHVINGSRFVEEETRQRVLQAIGELGYRPNILARSLTTKRTGIMGMLISDSSNYFFGQMIKGVEERLLSENYGLIVCNTNETLEREAHYLNLLLGLNVDGIIAAATSQQWNALYEAETHHTPVVFVDRKFEHMQGPFVGADNIQGACLGTRHLIQRGYQTIGCLAGFERLSTMRERLEGYRRALGEAGLPLRPEWIIPSELGVDAGKEAMRRLLQQAERPSAVFINNNLLALGAMLMMKEQNLCVPQDMAVLTFDDHPWAAISDPPLTVVRQQGHQMGQVAAELLLKKIAGEAQEPQEIILPCDLVIRASC
jgi:LacI family transcriptional regulator